MEFDFLQPLTLENERVLLRPLEQKDFDQLLFFSENEPTLWDF